MRKPPTKCKCGEPYSSATWYLGSRRCKQCELNHKRSKRRSNGVQPQRRAAMKYRNSPKQPASEWDKAITREIGRISAAVRQQPDAWERKCQSVVRGIRQRMKSVTGIRKQKQRGEACNWNECYSRSIQKLQQKIRQQMKSDWTKKADSVARNWRRKPVAPRRLQQAD